MTDVHTNVAQVVADRGIWISAWNMGIVTCGNGCIFFEIGSGAVRAILAVGYVCRTHIDGD
jgi:hypothetical protein